MLNDHPQCSNITWNITIDEIHRMDQREIRYYLSLLFLILSCVHVAISLFLFIALNIDGRVLHVKMRSKTLVIMTSLSILLHMCLAYIPIIVRPLPSWIQVTFLLLIVPFAAILPPAKLFSFYGRYIFSRAVAQVEIDALSGFVNDVIEEGDEELEEKQQINEFVTIIKEEKFNEIEKNDIHKQPRKSSRKSNSTGNEAILGHTTMNDIESQHGNDDVHGEIAYQGKIKQSKSNNTRKSDLSEGSGVSDDERDKSSRASYISLNRGSMTRFQDFRQSNLSKNSDGTLNIQSGETSLPTPSQAAEAIAAVRELNHRPSKNDGDSRRKVISARELLFLKFIASKEAQILLLILYISPFVAIIIANIVLLPALNPVAGCVHAQLLSINDDVVLASGAIAFVLGVCGALSVRRFPDPYGIATECRQYLQYGGLITLISFILDTYVTKFPYGFTFEYFIGLGLNTMLFTVTSYQIYIGVKDNQHGQFSFNYIKNILKSLGKRVRQRDGRRRESNVSVASHSAKNEHNKKLDEFASPQKLLELLEDPKETEDFEQFLIGEFSVEMLRMYLECKRWEKNYFDSPETTRRARAKKIVQLFIEDNAIFQVNLPGTIRNEIMKACENNKVDMSPDLFKRAQKEMLLMMHGAFRRYTKKKL